MVAGLLTLVKQDTILLVMLSVCAWMMGDGLDQCQFVKVHLFQLPFFGFSFCSKDISGTFLVPTGVVFQVDSHHIC